MLPPERLLGFPERMALLDCEATGGDASAHITEIAIIIVEHGEVVDTWQSLVNPGIPIPYYVARLTGITDEMVANAPSFDQLQGKVMELLQSRVLVAHNVSFDFKLLKNNFKRAGVDYQSQALCSHKLAKHFYPDDEALGIKALINKFDLQIEQHHRAMVDTEVVLHLFHQLSQNFAADKITAACQQLCYHAGQPQQKSKSTKTKHRHAPNKKALT